MLLKQIRDSILRTVGGGKTTMADPLDPEYLNNVIHAFRAEIIQRNYQQNKTINPICYQRYYLQYNKQFQDTDNVLKFIVPPTIQLGDEDGLRYIGAIDCASEWRRVFNRSELATLNAHKFTRLTSKNNLNTIYALYSSNLKTLEVYNGLNVREGMVEGIFANPLDVPTFNPDLDPYPLNEDDYAALESLIYRNRTAITKSTEPEYEFNVPAGKITGPPKGENLSRE